MSDLKCWTDGTDTIVAASKERAMEIQRQVTGVSIDEQEPAAEWSQLQPDKPQRIFDDNDKAVTKTIAAWIQENGEGYLCSSQI